MQWHRHQEGDVCGEREVRGTGSNFRPAPDLTDLSLSKSQWEEKNKQEKRIEPPWTRSVYYHKSLPLCHAITTTCWALFTVKTKCQKLLEVTSLFISKHVIELTRSFESVLITQAISQIQPLWCNKGQATVLVLVQELVLTNMSYFTFFQSLLFGFWNSFAFISIAFLSTWVYSTRMVDPV